MEIVKLAKKHGEKRCTICKTLYVNSAENFYRDRTAKDGLRCNCIKCEDRKQKNKTMSDLREMTEYKAIIAKNKEIQELKRTTGLQSATIQGKNSEIDYLQGKQRGLEESVKNSKLWNKGLFICLILWIIGSWVIMLM